MGQANLDSVIAQEAALLGLTAAALIEFRQATAGAFKDGFHDRSGVFHVSTAGWLRLPFRSNGVTATAAPRARCHCCCPARCRPAWWRTCG